MPGGVECLYNYEFNLLHHVGVVAKRVRAAAAHEGDDNTLSGLTGRGVKTNTFVLRFIYKNITVIHVIHSQFFPSSTNPLNIRKLFYGVFIIIH